MGSYWMMNSNAEPRCQGCDTVLVHSGAICVICDDQTHYEAPLRTSPPLRMPDTPESDDLGQRAAG